MTQGPVKYPVSRTETENSSVVTGYFPKANILEMVTGCGGCSSAIALFGSSPVGDTYHRSESEMGWRNRGKIPFGVLVGGSHRKPICRDDHHLGAVRTIAESLSWLMFLVDGLLACRHTSEQYYDNCYQPSPTLGHGRASFRSCRAMPTADGSDKHSPEPDGPFDDLRCCMHPPATFGKFMHQCGSGRVTW